MHVPMEMRKCLFMVAFRKTPVNYHKKEGEFFIPLKSKGFA